MNRVPPITYAIKNLADSRKFLSQYHDRVILTNAKGSTRYYGMLVLDYMFKKLQEEFSQIIKVIVNVEDAHPALFTAIKLNYHHIIYTGTSAEARRYLSAHTTKS